MKAKYCLYFAVIPLLIGILLQFYISSQELPADVTYTVEETIVVAGYGVELHTVETSDGYLLGVYRIVPKNAEPGNPVLMVPGLTHTAHSFVMNTGTKAPAFVLADAGYDVWLGNQRGNILSRKHKTLSPESAEFWDFTAVEIAERDLPAMIDYIKYKTNKAKISYVGHSQGAVTMVNLAALRPDIADSVAVAVAWCPFAGQITPTSTYFNIAISSWLHSFLELTGANVVGDWPTSTFWAKLAQGFPFALELLNQGRYNYSLNNDDPSRMPGYLHKMAGGTSFKNVVFIRQILERNSKHYTFYDYGEAGNLQKYGTKTPRQVDYNKIKTKFAIMGGAQDTITTPGDVQVLVDLMPKNTVVFKNLSYQLDHSGFVVSNVLHQMHDTLVVLKAYNP